MGRYCGKFFVGRNRGIDPIAVKEVIYQATAYLGIGRTYDFLLAANRIMELHGISLPLAPQATPFPQASAVNGWYQNNRVISPQEKEKLSKICLLAFIIK